MSDQYVSIIQVKNLWFFADFKQTPRGWEITKVKFAGQDREQAIKRATLSAESRQITFTEMNFSGSETASLTHQLQSKPAYRKAKRFLERTPKKPTHQSLARSQSVSKSSAKPKALEGGVASALKSDATTIQLPLVPEVSAVLPKSSSYSDSTVDISSTAIIYFDGGSCGNPGISGAAAIIDLPTGESQVFSEFILAANASLAEYSAALLGLRQALELGCKSIVIRGDRQETICDLLQLKVELKKEGTPLDTLHEAAFNLLSQFESVLVEWIPRKQNTRADAAVRKVIQANRTKTKKTSPKVSTSKPAKNKKTRTIKLKAAIDLLATMSLPIIKPSQPNAEQIERIVNLGKKAKISDYENLKSGWDEFSSKRLPVLMSMVPDVIKLTINDLLPKIEPQVTDEDKAKVFRWILRGLPAFMAVRKIEVDGLTKRQVVKAIARRGY